MVPSHMFGLVGQSSDPVVKSGISRKIFQERLSMVDKREMGGGKKRRKEGKKEGRKERKEGRKKEQEKEGRTERKKKGR